MAAPAHKSPGPKLFQKEEGEGMDGKIFGWEVVASGWGRGLKGLRGLKGVRGLRGKTSSRWTPSSGSHKFKHS